jgi:hypothetical protein
MTKLLLASLLLSACAESMDPAGSPDAMLAIDASAVDAPAPDDLPPPPPAPALWLLVNDTAAGTNELAKLDPTTFAILDRKTIAYSGPLWELAGNGSERAFTIDRDADRLLQLDLATGTIVTNVQLAGDMKQNGRGFGTAPDGSLWGIFDGTLARVDPITGALSSSVTQQYGLPAESLESCDGQLYMASREAGNPRGEKLYAVNRATGSATLRGTIATNIDIDTLACNDGALLGLDTDPTIGKMIYRIAPATGAGSVATTLSLIGDINGLHVTPTPAIIIE